MMSWLDTTDQLARVTVEVFLNSLWQGMALTALAWCLLQVFRQTNATTRYMIWLATLLLVICWPLLATRAPTDGSRISDPAALKGPSVARPLALAPEADQGSHSLDFTSGDQESLANSQSPNHPIVQSPVLPATGSSRPTLPSSQSGAFSLPLFPGRWPLFLFLGWLLTVAVRMTRVVWSTCHLRRLKRQCSPLTPSYQHRLKGWLAAYGPKRPVRLGRLPEIPMPMTVGLMKPVILVPASLVDQLTADELDQVVLHELAHIRRWDDWTNLTQKLAEAVFFFHPAVWLIGRRLNLNREIACDDWVVSLTDQPRHYAACLAKLIELTTWPRRLALASGAVTAGTQISRRIEMLLDKKRNATPRLSKSGIAAALSLLIVAVAQCEQISPVIAVPQPATPLVEPVDRAEAPRVLPPARQAQPVSKVDRRELLPRKPTIETPDRVVETQSASPQPAAKKAEQVLLAIIERYPQEEAQEQAQEVAPRLQEAQARVREVQAGTRLVQAQQRAERDRLRTVEAELAYQVEGLNTREPAIPESELLPLLTEIARTDSDMDVRKEAVRSIGWLRSDASVDALLQLVDELGDVKLKKEAISHLLRRKGDNRRAIDKLTQIAQSSSDLELRKAAFRQLARVRGDEGAEVLISIYEGSNDGEIKEAIIRYLGRNRSQRAANKLMSIARSDPDPKMRLAAVRSLSRQNSWGIGVLSVGEEGVGVYSLEPPDARPAPDAPQPPR